MTGNPNMDQAAFKKDIAKAASLVTAAQRLLSQGQVVDLGALEVHVAGLVESAKTLDEAAHSASRMLIVSLMNDIDTLHGEMIRQHTEMEHQLKSMSQTNRAAVAYGSTQKRR